ncbi:MAG TPA: hypothetical protein VI844_02130, partial [Coxiellaceae bacterium]|nr:hypothetical protein [Coxiellaceae bacterium]
MREVCEAGSRTEAYTDVLAASSRIPRSLEHKASGIRDQWDFHNMTLRQIWISYQTLVWKELVRTFRIWPQTLVPPAITMSLYFLIFGKLVGAQIRPLNGFTYMQFIVPGLVMMTVITNSYIHTSSSFFGMKFQKSIEEILVSPMPNAVILLGFVTGALVRALLVGMIVMSVALLFTHISIQHGWMML